MGEVPPHSAVRVAAPARRLTGHSGQRHHPRAWCEPAVLAPNRLSQRYHAVLRLAEVIWQATSPEHVPGSLLANGFLFNLWKIFENFLVAALSEELHLDQARVVEMKPDLVWQVNGQPVAVVDAKYKPEKPSGYPYADLYQVLAYCTALHLPRGHLVYARGNSQPARHIVRYSDIEIVCHALDLTLPRAKLLAQVRDIADEVVVSVPAA
ncbi:MAG: 5-methylcytosine restriction system specificity protein McrC [Pseudonocardiaceae bacterium]